ncbi:MAG: hypothetical protein M3N06_07030, partial [Pseudomonadota bacterium]|nr:hypothetical protein [Pseudomonadota bacterium]
MARLFAARFFAVGAVLAGGSVAAGFFRAGGAFWRGFGFGGRYWLRRSLCPWRTSTLFAGGFFGCRRC